MKLLLEIAATKLPNAATKDQICEVQSCWKLQLIKSEIVDDKPAEYSSKEATNPPENQQQQQVRRAANTLCISLCPCFLLSLSLLAKNQVQLAVSGRTRMMSSLVKELFFFPSLAMMCCPLLIMTPLRLVYDSNMKRKLHILPPYMMGFEKFTQTLS